MTKEGQDVVKKELSSLDWVAFLAQDGWILKETIVPKMNPMIIKVWNELEGYVDYKAESRKVSDDNSVARKLCRLCLLWLEIQPDGIEKNGLRKHDNMQAK